MKVSKVIFHGTILLYAYSVICFSCQTNTDQTSSVSSQLPEQPNILWLVTEDMGHYIPPFGDSTIRTPTLSRLADEGVINIYNGKKLNFKGIDNKSNGNVRISGSKSEEISFESSTIKPTQIKCGGSAKTDAYKIVSTL